jgi:predicted nucleic acid-binding Zn ribbon protein
MPSSYYPDWTPGLAVNYRRDREAINCQLCGQALPITRRWNQRYCNATCKFEHNRQRVAAIRQKKKEKESAN